MANERRTIHERSVADLEKKKRDREAAQRDLEAAERAVEAAQRTEELYRPPAGQPDRGVRRY